MNNLGRFWRLLRTYSQFHENEKLIAWLQQQRWVVWLTPQRRRWFLTLAAVTAGMLGTVNRYKNLRFDSAEKYWFVPIVAFLVLSAALYVIYFTAAHYQILPALIKRRPQLSLHLLFWGFLAGLRFLPQDDAWWRSCLLLIAISCPFLIWRCGYVLMSGRRGNAQNTSFSTHFIYLWPAWGGTNTPIGKGSDYLSQCEAKTAQDYARSVLSASRLMMLSLFLELARLCLRAATDYLGIPRIKDIVTGKTEASLAMTWLCLYLELIWDATTLAAHGHRWVAVLRLFGFNVFRNTYKPLLAETLVAFWNRYYYYFKELLAEFFFFPIYLRFFHAWPKLRILAAVFAAAFVGNLYYHFLQLKNPLAIGDLAEIAEGWSSRVIYCFALSVGIYLSLLRQQRQRGRVLQLSPAMKHFARLRRIAGVWTFYALLNYWNLKTGFPVLERLKVFLSFFGI